jgi:hypothetical protein
MLGIDFFMTLPKEKRKLTQDRLADNLHFSMLYTSFNLQQITQHTTPFLAEITDSFAAIVVAIISLVSSMGVVLLQYFLKQRMHAQEERSRQNKERIAQQGDQIAKQQQAISMLVQYTMSASIFRHLCGIARLKTYYLDFGETNRRELYFLRDHGYIQPSGGGFLDFPDGRYNVCDMAVPTPVGVEYVDLRKDEIPPEMLKDLTNLRSKS